MIAPDPSVVLYERGSDQIALVTLNRPDARNAISRATASRLAEIVRLTEEDKSVRVVILTGAGGQAFCAGADLKEVNAGGMGDMFLDSGFAGFVDAQRSKPWIAAVNGFALAGGCEIALACDLIVAAETARFGLPEVAPGVDRRGWWRISTRPAHPVKSCDGTHPHRSHDECRGSRALGPA
jgi:enoyl-CoA hydratase/carnithine racemase